jgi:hypothetical protein
VVEPRRAPEPRECDWPGCQTEVSTIRGDKFCGYHEKVALGLIQTDGRGQPFRSG